MPQSASAAKHLRQNITRQERNRAARSTVRTQIRAFDKAVQSGDTEKVQTELLKSHSILDQAASGGLVKKNYTNRKKSQLARALNSLSK